MGAKGIFVRGGNTSLQYVNQDNNNPIQGMMRVWGNDIQVFNSGVWQNVSSSYATIELDQSTQDIIEWVREKKLEEELLLTLPSDHPSVRAAKQNLNKAKLEVKRLSEQLKITEILTKDEEPTS